MLMCLPFLLTSQMDSIVVCLVWLTLWVFALVYHFNNIHIGSVFMCLTLILSLITCCFFSSFNTLNFYIFFEISIPPTLFVILIFGYQPENLAASTYLILYTVLSSLPMLIVLLTLPVYLSAIVNSNSLFTILAITLCFIVNTPMYLVHIWLPNAHVEAPVAGSMVLAGVLLNIGSYGLFVFLPVYCHWFLFFYLVLSVVGGVVCCFSCVRQWDTNGLIAYSSIVHMGVVSIGLVSGSELGYHCGLVMVIAHGVCSPLLFGIAFYIYTNSSSRLLAHNRGTLGTPVAASILFVLLAVNIGVPPFVNVWAEVLVFVVLLRLITYCLPFLCALALFSFLYNIVIYIMTTHGKESNYPTVLIIPWHYVSSLSLSILISLNLSFFML